MVAQIFIPPLSLIFFRIFLNRLILIDAHMYFEPKMVGSFELIKMASAQPLFSTTLENEHANRAESLVQTWMNPHLEHGLQTLNLRYELPDVRCPTLVIQGENDAIATPQHAIDIAAGIENAPLWLIPDVGHMPFQEIPTRFNYRRLQFLEVNPEQPASLKKSSSE